MAASIAPEVRALVRSSNGRPLRLLDVATGAGDVPIALARWARRQGLRLTVHGCDRSPFAVAFARRRAEEEGESADFFAFDAVAGHLPAGYDVITSSLFLHHLDDADTVRVLSAMAGAARRGLVISDLLRSRLGLTLAWLATRVLTRSEIARVDGPRSVRAAFTLEELRALVVRAGLEGARVEPAWPERVLLTWSRA